MRLLNFMAIFKRQMMMAVVSFKINQNPLKARTTIGHGYITDDSGPAF